MSKDSFHERSGEWEFLIAALRDHEKELDRLLGELEAVAVGLTQGVVCFSDVLGRVEGKVVFLERACKRFNGFV